MDANTLSTLLTVATIATPVISGLQFFLLWKKMNSDAQTDIQTRLVRIEMQIASDSSHTAESFNLVRQDLLGVRNDIRVLTGAHLNKNLNEIK